MAKKLTADVVANIKKAFQVYPGLKMSDVAKQLKVSYDTIWDIVKERYWKNVTPSEEHVCPHCLMTLETIKAYCTITDYYMFLDDKPNQIDCYTGGDDPDTYKYMCGECEYDLTRMVLRNEFMPERYSIGKDKRK